MKRLVVLLAVLCVLGSLLLADGGERVITATEKSFFETSYKKVLDLLPAAPEGVSREPEELSIPKTLGLGADKYPILFTFYCNYRKEVSMQEAMAGATMLADDSQGIEDMSSQMNQITEELTKAAEAGDQKKLVELQARMQAVLQGNAGMAKMQETIDEQKQQSVSMNISLNASGADYYLYKEIPAPANVTLAIRRQKNENSDSETVLFFGLYGKKSYEDTLQIYAENKPAESTRIHRLIIALTGEPEVCDAYIAKMNFAGLAALIK